MAFSIPSLPAILRCSLGWRARHHRSLPPQGQPVAAPAGPHTQWHSRVPSLLNLIPCCCRWQQLSPATSFRRSDWDVSLWVPLSLDSRHGVSFELPLAGSFGLLKIEHWSGTMRPWNSTTAPFNPPFISYFKLNPGVPLSWFEALSVFSLTHFGDLFNVLPSGFKSDFPHNAALNVCLVAWPSPAAAPTARSQFGERAQNPGRGPFGPVTHPPQIQSPSLPRRPQPLIEQCMSLIRKSHP